MKNLIVLVAIGLTIGMTGAVGIVVAREKQVRAARPPAADSTLVHADSLHADEHPVDAAPADSGEGHALPTDSVTRLAAGGADTLVGHGTAAGPAQPESISAEVIAATSAAGPDEQRLARIFAAMRPEQAARVLEQMTDPEVRRLLSHLRERQAAAIMSSIAPERAAVISSAVIRGEWSAP